MVTLLPALLDADAARRGDGEKKLLDRRIGRVLFALHGRPLAARAGRRRARALATLGLPPLRPGLPRPPAARLRGGAARARDGRPLGPSRRSSPPSSAPRRSAARELAGRSPRTTRSARCSSVADARPARGAGGEPIARARAAFRAHFVAPDGRSAVYAYPNGRHLGSRAVATRSWRGCARSTPRSPACRSSARFMIELSQRAFRIGVGLAALAVVADRRLGLPRPAAHRDRLLPTALTLAAIPGLMKLARPRRSTRSTSWRCRW